MKSPLTKTQDALRELACFILGHPWKSSWRRNERALDTTDYETLPYRDRQSGNPYFEYSAGWHYKCRRCRQRTRDESFQPFYLDYYRALSNGIRSVVFSWRFRTDEHLKIQSYVWFVTWCGLSGLTQVVAYLTDARHWPEFIQWWVVEAEWKAGEKAFQDIE